ncbi:transcriptional regulator [Candidatus Moduliflexus flocculans]|uniref:Transcriptional regulator n=1 Tax=Candidatus Moduliflexus flocculans TaxID=1499966 RepID=A0A0S6VRR3_9BACT|nr:transcriptional regulator [Candidatus Moduliflexus flocculans]
MSIPTPGQPVRGSKTGVPIMALFDLLGRTWALGVLWQLQDGPYTFRELQEKCESISPSILNSRIKDLRKAAIVERTLDGYQLTARGHQLVTIIRPFGEWSREWAKEVFHLPEDATQATEQ